MRRIQLILILFLTPFGLSAREPSSLEAFRADPLAFFYQGKAAEGVAAGRALLEQGDLPSETRHRVLLTLACLYLADERDDLADAAFLEMLDAAPRADLENADALPPPVIQRYYELRDARLLAQDLPPAYSITTLAVGDIEDNSIMEGDLDLKKFARGLSQIIMTDLQQASSLTLVDRQRLNVLRREIALNQSDTVNPEFRVALGKLTGASTYLFGNVWRVKKGTVRIDLRWVETATGEVLLSEGKEFKLRSGEDLLKMEEEVVLGMLLPKMERFLENDEALRGDLGYVFEQKREASGRSQYLDFILAMGDALLKEEHGEYESARDAWTKAQGFRQSYPTAESRIRALTAWVEQRESQ